MVEVRFDLVRLKNGTGGVQNVEGDAVRLDDLLTLDVNLHGVSCDKSVAMSWLSFLHGAGAHGVRSTGTGRLHVGGLQLRVTERRSKRGRTTEFGVWSSIADEWRATFVT